MSISNVRRRCGRIEVGMAIGRSPVIIAVGCNLDGQVEIRTLVFSFVVSDAIGCSQFRYSVHNRYVYPIT